MNDNWKRQEYFSKGYGNKDVKRVLYVDNTENPKYKFKEEIDFIAGNNAPPYAICIGLNPAKAKKDLDDTNKRLINLLENDYSGYYLFNIYPEITENATQINFNDEENVSFVNKLEVMLQDTVYNRLDIILFFGRTLIIPDQLLQLLQRWIEEKKNIYITVHNGEFTHPRANAKIEKIELKKEYLRTNTSIRIKE